MSLAAKNTTEALVLDTWIRTGKPVLSQLKRHSTFALVFGKPSTTMVNDVYSGKNLPQVGFERLQKLNMDGRYYAFPLIENLNAGAFVARGSSMTSSRSPVTTAIGDALRFQSTYYVINYDISRDKLDELKGAQWAIDGSYVSASGNAIMRKYFDTAASAVWATGAGVMPVDGVLGSIRGQISDGLTNATRGSGGDESNYATIAGYTRSTSNLAMSSGYRYGSGAALAITDLETMAQNMFDNGATRAVFPMNAARYLKFQNTLRGTYGTNSLEVADDLADLGVPSGIKLKGAQWACYIDNDIPAGTWQVGLNLDCIYAGADYGSVSMRQIENPATVDSILLRGEFKNQVMVTDPRTCHLMENLESL